MEGGEGTQGLAKKSHRKDRLVWSRVTGPEAEGFLVDIDLIVDGRRHFGACEVQNLGLCDAASR